MQFVRSKKFTDPMFNEKKSKFKDEAAVRITAFHYGNQMITVGLSDGSIMQYKKKEFDQKHFLISKEHQIVRFSEIKTPHKGEITCLLVEQIKGISFIFTGSADRTIKLWENDPKVKSCIQTLFGHNGTVMAIAYGSDTLFSASNDKTLKIWKQESGREFLYHPWFVVFQVVYDFAMKKSLNQQSYITAFLPKGPVFSLYAGDTDGSLHILKYDEDNQKKQLKIDKSYFNFHRIHVIQIIEIEKDNAIFSIGFDQKIMGFGESGGKFFTYKNPHKCLFTSLQWSSVHQELVVSDQQGRIYFMNISSDKQVLEFKLYDVKIQRIQLIENLDRLIVFTDSFIDVLEIKRGVRAGNVLEQHKGPIIGLICIEFPRIKNQYLEPDKLISASLDNTMRVWDPKDMTCLSVMENSEKSEIAAVHYLQNANLLATGHDNGEIRLWNIEIGSYLVLDQSKTKHRHVNTVCALTSNVFQSGEEFLFSSGYDGKINVWEIFERKQRLMASYIMPQLKQSIIVKPKANIDSIGNEILCLLFDKITNCIVAAGNDCCIYFIEMLIYEHRIILRGHKDSIVCLAIDGKILFSGSQDKTIRLWDTKGCQILTTLNLNESGVQNIMILPDTGHLVSIGSGTLLIWDYPNQKTVGKLQKQETMRSITYLEAERTFFIGTEENSIHSCQLDDIFSNQGSIDKQIFPDNDDKFKEARDKKKLYVFSSGDEEEPEISPQRNNKKKTQIIHDYDNLNSNDFLRQLEEQQKQILQELAQK